MVRQAGLGRGIGSLIPTEHTGDQTGVLREIPLSAIDANPLQPRRGFTEEALVSLAASVKEVGILQPVLVRELPGGRYELIAGERRWRAAKRAGLNLIPALVREAEDLHAFEQALIENLHREDLTPLEEAGAYQQLLERFHLSHEQIAQRVGKHRSSISNALRLLALPPAIQQLLSSGRLSAGHARALLGTPDRVFQERLAERAVADQLSVREVEDAIKQHEERGPRAPRRPPVMPERSPAILELEHLLSAYLDTKVTVEESRTASKLVVRFADLDDLERIYQRIVEGYTPGSALS